MRLCACVCVCVCVCVFRCVSLRVLLLHLRRECVSAYLHVVCLYLRLALGPWLCRCLCPGGVGGRRERERERERAWLVCVGVCVGAHVCACGVLSLSVAIAIRYIGIRYVAPIRPSTPPLLPLLPPLPQISIRPPATGRGCSMRPQGGSRGGVGAVCRRRWDEVAGGGSDSTRW